MSCHNFVIEGFSILKGIEILILMELMATQILFHLGSEKDYQNSVV